MTSFHNPFQRLRGAAVVFTVLSVVLATSGCGSGTDGEAGSNGSRTTSGESRDGGSVEDLPDKIPVSAIVSLTGAVAFCGKNEVDGMRLAFKQAEKSGEVGDSTFDLKTFDDASTAEGGVSAFQQAVAAEPAALLGVCFSPVAQAIVPTIDDTKVPFIVTNASGANVTEPEYAYRSAIPQFEYAPRTIDALGSRGVKKVAIIFQRDNQGIVDILNSSMKPKLKELGIEIVAEEGVTAETQDFSSQASVVRKAKPDAVGVLAAGGANVTIVTQLRQAGIDVPIFGQAAMAGSYYISTGGDAVNGTIYAVNYDPALDQPSSVKFREAFEKEYDRQPDFTAASGYDAARMLIEAVKKAGSIDHDAIKDALDALDGFDGAQGSLTLTDQGDTKGDGVVVEVKDGKTVPVAKD